jgi:hypothetical protein
MEGIAGVHVDQMERLAANGQLERRGGCMPRLLQADVRPAQSILGKIDLPPINSLALWAELEAPTSDWPEIRK